jgi:hypothetical protein
VNINRFRMTASEIAMGRYMRAPDHPAATDFDTAFAEFASPDDKKPADAAAAGSGDGGAAASGGAGDGQGAGGDSGGGSGGADAGAGDGGAGDGSGGAASGATGGEAAAAGADGATGATGDGTGGDGAGAGAGAAAGADAGAAAGAASGSDAGAAAAKPGDAAGAAGAEAAAGAAAAGAAAPDADAILAGLKKLVGQGEAPAAGAEAAGGEAAGDGAAAGGAPAPIYNDEETAFLKKYDEDWGDVVRGEALKRRAEYQQLLSHVFSQVANFVKPIQETADQLAERTFSTDLRTAVPDYSNQLRDEVTTWVKSQPTYLQVAYNHVITEGTVDEVKDLVERYRTATGKAAPKPAGAGGAAPKPAGAGNELSDEAKKAAAALAPVDSKRSGVSAPSDPSNFDDAWKQASTDLG